MRRTPLAMAESETSQNAPISPVRETCVPPHSSRLGSMPCSGTPAVVTSRTSAPYFSPNSIIAPSVFACAIVMTSQRTSRSASTHSLTRSSMRASCPAEGASKCW